VVEIAPPKGTAPEPYTTDSAGSARTNCCDKAGSSGVSYNSCRDRHCPKHAQGGINAGHGNRGGALDVVVETTDAFAVTGHDWHGMEVGKVLELDTAARRLTLSDG
jgi:hypothetical protein